MTDNRQEFDEFSIVPERDELRTHGKTRRATSGSAQRGPAVDNHMPADAPYRASGAMRFLISLLAVGMLATIGGAYFFFSQGQVALASLDNATARIMQLENRLSMVGQAAEQTSVSFIERVDFNFSEIDKLWAARNQNVSNIAANTVLTTNQTESITAIQTAVANQAGMVNQNTASLSDVDVQLGVVRNNIAGMDDLDQQLTVINADLNRVKSAMNVLEQSVATQMGSAQLDVQGRINTTEQDIESINISRLQTNQRLSTMQDSINRLQELVGQ